MTRAIDRESVAWGEEEDQRRPRVPIISPRPGRPVKCLLLGGLRETVRVHWYDGRTWPCYGSKLKCEGCRRRSAGRKTKHYLCGCFPLSRGLCMPEVTPYALRVCPALETPAGLRGMLLILERIGVSSCSPVVGKIEEPRAVRGLLPDFFDIREELYRIWEGEDRK